jgi:Holliday junction resolvase
MNKRYIKGRNFEYRVKKYFEDKKYFVVRAAGSKGIADLVAIPHAFDKSQLYPLIVQCKNTNYKKVNKSELEKFYIFAMLHKCEPVLAARDGRRMVFFKGEEIKKLAGD